MLAMRTHRPFSNGSTLTKPQKLLMSKWKVLEACDKEKHFLVARVISPEAPRHKTQEVEMEAVMTGRRHTMSWNEPADATKWAQGWI